ncbi:MAG: hypothetical protein ACK5LC_11420, partial [Coprobacillaceae bacterium]
MDQEEKKLEETKVDESKTEDKTESSTEKTFTQEEVNGLVAAAKRDIKQPFDELFKDLEVSNVNELKTAITSLQDQNKKGQLNTIKVKSLAEAGLNIDLADVIKGDDEETILQNVLKISETLKTNATVTDPVVNVEKTT